ncbi:hypothetical protein M9H77_11149 [Catharanthus roseus]|uniref:Uncharacterized protein n=1 Tax=Catharanthus roseus TaxID=4058 RepID=A0ACC0BDT3_CATRO|nr:hypothetical protein M9H77_11149 [Catharanthus roseus]
MREKFNVLASKLLYWKRAVAKLLYLKRAGKEGKRVGAGAPLTDEEPYYNIGIGCAKTPALKVRITRLVVPIPDQTRSNNSFCRISSTNAISDAMFQFEKTEYVDPLTRAKLDLFFFRESGIGCSGRKQLRWVLLSQQRKTQGLGSFIITLEKRNLQAQTSRPLKLSFYPTLLLRHRKQNYLTEGTQRPEHCVIRGGQNRKKTSSSI